MGVLDIAQEELPELQIAEEGENELQISYAEATEYSTGRKGYIVKLKLPNLPNSKTIRHNVTLPTEEDDEEKANNIKRSVQSFVKCFNLNSNEPEDWIGSRGWAILGVEKDQEGIYGDRNNIKRFLEPK